MKNDNFCFGNLKKILVLTLIGIVIAVPAFAERRSYEERQRDREARQRDRAERKENGDNRPGLRALTTLAGMVIGHEVSGGDPLATAAGGGAGYAIGSAIDREIGPREDRSLAQREALNQRSFQPGVRYGIWSDSSGYNGHIVFVNAYYINTLPCREYHDFYGDPWSGSCRRTVVSCLGAGPFGWQEYNSTQWRCSPSFRYNHGLSAPPHFR